MTSEEISDATTDVDINVDETTALLAGPGKPQATLHNEADDNASSPTSSPEASDKALPKDQIFFLCLARMVEPIAFFCIFPFINKMIWDTGEVAKTDVGFYSGLIVCAQVPQMFLLSLSDSSNLGISILANSDALDDTLGLGRRPRG